LALPFASFVSIADTSVGVPLVFDPEGDSGCLGAFFSGTGPVFWLKLESAPPGTLLDVTSCGFDTDLSVFQGPSCGQLSMIACNGDADVDGCAAESPSRISGVEVAAGTNYYVVVGGFKGASGSATVTALYKLALPPPPPSPPRLPQPPPPPMLPLPPFTPIPLGSSQYATSTAELRWHLQNALASRQNASLTLPPGWTFALGGEALVCNAPIEFSIASFSDGAILDAQDRTRHFDLQNGCRLVLQHLSLINGNSDQVQ
jgi:hypothetical protein